VPISMIEKATQWILANTVPDKGIIVHSRQRVPYPEVSGYYIPTLLSIGRTDLAKQYARWLTKIQHADGSFGGPTGTGCYAFDTGQIIRGWVSILDQMPDLLPHLRGACDWLIRSADPATGRLLVPPPGTDWSLGARGEVNEAIHLYALAPLQSVARKIADRTYAKFVDKSLGYYLNRTDVTDFTRRNHLSHFFAYIQDALLDLGRIDLAKKGMASVAAHQRPNGAVPGYSDVSWVCSTGLAQLAIVWYRIGETARAEAAMGFLAKLQNPSGGFMGSYGIGADYFPAAEIAWAVKYCIDATHLQIARHFDDTVGEYSNSIDPSDGRVRAVLTHLGTLKGKRLLDAGCGKGRYAALLKRTYPECATTAMDISQKMLGCVPAGIERVQSSLLNIPMPDSSYDAVICIEALEHAVEIPKAVSELSRVLAPGGKLVIIDKNKDRLGQLAMPSWEKWFGKTELADLLRSEGLKVSSEFIAYDRHAEPDGLFICWTGTKP